MTTEGFASRIAPGAVFVDGRVIDYALRRSTVGCAVLHIVDLFPPGDERAVLAFALGYEAAAMTTPQLRDFVETAIYRRAAAFVRGADEATVAVPDRIGEWMRGLTVADVAAINEAQRKVEPDQRVIILEDRRRARRAS